MIRPTDLSFSQFIQTPESRSAWIVCTLLARRLIRNRRTPLLFIHGPNGSGKSHLAAAVTQQLIHSRSDATTATLTAGDLNALSLDPLSGDWADLRSPDLLVLEDLQRLNADRSERLAPLLDYRTSRGRAVLATSTLGPARLKHLPARLTSRLANGLVVHIPPLSRRSRAKLLRQFSRQAGLILSPDVRRFLLNRLAPGVRPIQGAVHSLRGLGVVTLEQVRELFTDAPPPPQPWEILLAGVAREFAISQDQILATDRSPAVLHARQAAMYLCRQAGLSLPRIGQIFHRDHSTVLHAIRKIEGRLAENPDLARQLARLQEEIR